MKKSFFPLLWLTMTFIFLACGEKRDNREARAGEKTKTPAEIPWHKPPSSFQDSVLVYPDAAVFFQPDSLQMEKIGKVTSRNVFLTVRHDCYFQMRNATIVIRRYWPQIRIIEVSRARFLIFSRADSGKRKIDLDEVGDICGIYLFNGERDPVRIDMANIDSELGFYFKKK